MPTSPQRKRRIIWDDARETCVRPHGAGPAWSADMIGEVVYLYAFDVANEIATAKVESILSQKPFPFEIREERTIPRDFPVYKPLSVEPPSTKTCLGGRPLRILIRIYEVGVVSIAARVGFTVDTLSE